MSDEQTEHPAVVSDPVVQHEGHKGFLARIEDALHELPNPAHFADWLKQEFAKFRA